LLAVGAVILFVRKSEDWAAFPLLLVVAIPCALLFGVGVVAALGTGAVARWHAVLMVTGVLLSPIAFGQLWDTVGVDTDSSGFGLLLFACTTALAAFGSFRAGAAYQAFLAAVAGIFAWLSLFDLILDDPGATTFRWLLLVLCFAYAVVAFRLMETDRPQASELVTAAGLAGVLVGTLGVLQGASEGLGGLFIAGELGEGGGQGFGWDLFLLLFSLGLVAYGAAAPARGPAYVGFVGLLAFAIVQGVEVNALLEGETPDGSFAGWPLALLLIGGAALAAGMFLRTPPEPGPPPSPGAPPRS
ncbi:MAG: hypothetical protein ACRDL4_20595, partial [Thermoleophilaceae bacterium]